MEDARAEQFGLEERSAGWPVMGLATRPPWPKESNCCAFLKYHCIRLALRFY